MTNGERPANPYLSLLQQPAERRSFRQNVLLFGVLVQLCQIGKGARAQRFVQVNRLLFTVKRNETYVY